MAAAAHWTSLFLLVLVWTEHLSDAVPPAQLSSVVSKVKRKYQPNGMFSMAVRVPTDQNQRVDSYIKVLEDDDSPATVRTQVGNGQVYRGKWLVEAARIVGPPAVHAEARVAQELNYLHGRREINVPDWLIFYSFASPCDHVCTNSQHRDNILQSLTGMKQWSTRVFVFSTIFQPRNGPAIPEQSLRESLQRLGGVIGNANIYRCVGATCTACFSGNQVSNICVSG